MHAGERGPPKRLRRMHVLLGHIRRAEPIGPAAPGQGE
jgi:hypothetical protein